MEEPLPLEPKVGDHQFVRSMGVDAEGIMWIVGKLADNACLSMEVYIDVPLETVEGKFEFTTEGARNDHTSGMT